MGDTQTQYQREINLGEHGFENPEYLAKTQAWLIANRVNPEDVPIYQCIPIVGDKMNVTFFYRDPTSGHKVVTESGFRKIQSWVKLIARPEVFGL